MAHVVSITDATAPPPGLHCHIDIMEERVFAHLGPNTEPQPDRWVLDIGATNHMVGARSTFFELDGNVHSTVCFGDGSVAKIKGSGTVIFTCKNGEHRALIGVYYLPRLTANIISIGQLDEAGCRIEPKHGASGCTNQGAS